MSRDPHIVNVNDLPWAESRHGERFAAGRKAFTAAAGGAQLGCSLYRVPPGKAAFPYHKHHGNEEALYVLRGTGRLRLGAAEHEVGAGDYVALPAGGPAHQLIATGTEPLEYLCFSTMIVPDVFEYPDSGKVGAFAGAGPGGDKARRTFAGFYKLGTEVDYYDGE